MNNLHEALEVCLQDIELGADIETALLRYPNFANELRPILETSAHAKRLASPAPSEAMMQRNRAKLLQRAAEMRNARLSSSSTPNWFNAFRRAAIVLAVLALVVLSGTGLVRASSNTLPGDNLYKVKRTWEDVALLFTLDLQSRNSLEVEYANERLYELHELISLGRSVRVDFVGIVTQQNANEWWVAGVPVIITPQTDLHDGAVSVGDAVRVFGMTQSNNSILAERIDQLPESANLPDVGNSGSGSSSGSNSGSGSGHDNNSNDNNSGPGGGSDNGNEDNSGPGGENDNSNDNNSGPGGGDNTNDDNSGSGSGNDNENNNGSGSGRDQSNDNGSEDNSGSGSGSDNSNEDNSGPGGGGDDD